MANYLPVIRAAARRYGVNPNILIAQLRQESGLNPNARSPKGAQGIAQFIPSTAKSYGVNLGDNDATDDIDGAARYMRDNLKQFGGDYRKALAAYNAGAGAVSKYGGVPPYAETQNYVKNILAAAGDGGATDPATPNGPSAAPEQTVAVPGVDNAGTRKQLLLDYFQGGRHQPGALIALKQALDGAQDVPGSSYTVPGDSDGGSKPGKFKHGSLNELFWQGAHGIDVKDGKVVPQGFVSGHQDHVHVADDQVRTLMRVAKHAEQMGLNVGENPRYGGVDPVHADGSYHYRKKRGIGEAIDVSGDAKKMAQFAKWVARKYGVNR